MKRDCIILLWILCVLLLIGCVKPQQIQPEENIVPDAESEEIVFSAAETPAQAMAVATLPPTPEETQKPAETPAPAPTGESTGYAAAEGVYTIAWISDPQHYSKKFPETYYAMTSFLRDHCEALHLTYIVHTGDFVHNTDREAEWEVADKAQKMIDEIPNGVLAGNHDVLDPIGYKTFCKVFGEKRYKDKPWYGESYENNRGHYDLVTIGSTDYLFVYMGFEPDKQAFAWVRDVFKKYPERIGVLCLHDYYTKQLTLSEDGAKWHDRVVAESPNLYMVLCGHKYGAHCFPETFDDDGDGKPDRTVYQMMFNYQASQHDGGGGYLRLMQIDEAAGTLRNLTYSPLLEDFNRFDDPTYREENYMFDEKNEEFTLPLPWTIVY